MCRDNMVVKYGKGYAMAATTRLTVDFSEGANTVELLAMKRKQASIALLICKSLFSKILNIMTRKN